MRRLILLVCVLGLLSGCGKAKPTTADGSGGSGGSANYNQGQVKAKGGSSAAQMAEDHIAGSYKGQSYKIDSVEEKPAKFKGADAVVVYVKYSLDGEAKGELLLVVDGRVKYSDAFDATKNLDENVTAFIKKMEAP